MSEPKRIILHVGLHKTGTTFLQDRVFPELPGVRFVHPLHYAQASDGPIERFMLELFFRNAAHIDVDHHRKAIAAWLARVEEPTVLISSEAIVGWPIENHSNFRVNADLLAELFPSAQVVFVVRRQDRWVESAYSQVLKAGFSTSIERYLNFREGRFQRYNVGLYHGPNVDARDLDWGPFDAHYRRRFGERAVCTLPFELFTRDSDAFLRHIYAFMAVEGGPFPDASQRVNTSWSPLAANVARVVNTIPMPVKRALRERIPKDLHPAELVSRVSAVAPGLGLGKPGSGPKASAAKPKKKKRFLSPELAAALMDLHRENNEALGARIGFDLSAYDY